MQPGYCSFFIFPITDLFVLLLNPTEYFWHKRFKNGVDGLVRKVVGVGAFISHKFHLTQFHFHKSFHKGRSKAKHEWNHFQEATKNTPTQSWASCLHKRRQQCIVLHWVLFHVLLLVPQTPGTPRPTVSELQRSAVQRETEKRNGEHTVSFLQTQCSSRSCQGHLHPAWLTAGRRKELYSYNHMWKQLFSLPSV